MIVWACCCFFTFYSFFYFVIKHNLFSLFARQIYLFFCFFFFVLRVCSLEKACDFISYSVHCLFQFFAFPCVVRRKGRTGFSSNTLIFPVSKHSIKAPCPFIFSLPNGKTEVQHVNIKTVQDKMIVGCESASQYCVAQTTHFFCSGVCYVLKPYRGKCYDRSSWDAEHSTAYCCL